MEEGNFITDINSLTLIIGIIMGIVGGWYSAFKYKDTNDYKKSIFLFIPVCIIYFSIFAIAGLSVILTLSLCVASFICMSLFSNYYFYH